MSLHGDHAVPSPSIKTRAVVISLFLHSLLAGRCLGELQELHDVVHCFGRQSRQVLGLAHFMALEHVRGEGFCDLWGENDKEATKEMREEEERRRRRKRRIERSRRERIRKRIERRRRRRKRKRQRE